MIYPDKIYLLTFEAHDGLVELFAGQSKSTKSRRWNQRVMYNGYTMEPILGDRQPEGISHGLNVLSMMYDVDEFIPTPPRKLVIEKPVFHSIKEARDYRAMYGNPSYKVLWSNKQIMDYSDKEDSSGEFPLVYTRKPWWYRLSPGAISFYTHLAMMHDMQPPSIQLNVTSHKYVSAALEAIGCKWLKLPEGYMEVLKELPNKNKVRTIVRRRPVGSRLYGNHSHTAFTPDMSVVQPFTRERMLELRKQMIENGEITDDSE